MCEQSPKGEFELIRWIRQRAEKQAGPHVELGIGDDMAEVRFGGERLLVSCDMIVDGVHFDTNRHGYRQIGYKALACNLSDCAAMAARPVAALVSVALPEKLTMEQAREIYLGMEQLCQRYGCPLIGGDTTSWSGRLAIDVMVLARPCLDRPVRRAGAKPGDLIIVTGDLGGSVLGKHLQFEPRVEEACWLAEHWPVHAMIDISDGLVADLGHICEASDVGAVLEGPLLEMTISSAAVELSGQDGTPALEHALCDGEDFELLVVCDPHIDVQQVPPPDLLVHAIGTIKAGSGIELKSEDGGMQPLRAKGYEHFK